MEYDDILSVLRGKPIGKPIICLWRHYPKVDTDPKALLSATLNDLKKFPSDLIKLSPHGKYAMVDFGCEIKAGSSAHGATGSTSCVRCSVNSESDWAKIQEIDIMNGHYGEQVEYVRKMKEKYPDKPVMMTVFSPTMVARKLSANQMPVHLQNGSKNLDEALKVISKTTIEFARACIDAGADGIFSAIQEADRTLIDDNRLLDKLIKLNNPFMKSIKSKAEFTVLHLHGDDVLFKETVAYYRPTAVNWHDRTSYPSLMEASKIFRGGLLGGLNVNSVLNGDLDINEVKDLYIDIPHILAPGCVILQGTEDKMLHQIFEEYQK